MTALVIFCFIDSSNCLSMCVLLLLATLYNTHLQASCFACAWSPCPGAELAGLLQQWDLLQKFTQPAGKQNGFEINSCVLHMVAGVALICPAVSCRLAVVHLPLGPTTPAHTVMQLHSAVGGAALTDACNLLRLSLRSYSSICMC